MNIRYSKATGAFYPLEIEYKDLPADIQEVALTDYEKAMARPVGHSFAFDASGKLTITPPPAPSIEDLRVAKLTEINNAASAVAAKLTEGYPDFEIQTWNDQQREALTWEANNATPTPTVDRMAGYRGIDRVLYLQKTVAKVHHFQQASAYLVGTRQRYVDQANAAKTPEALDEIKPVFTLPVSP